MFFLKIQKMSNVKMMRLSLKVEHDIPNFICGEKLMRISHSILHMKYLLLFTVITLFFDLDDNSDPWLNDLCI